MTLGTELERVARMKNVPKNPKNMSKIFNVPVMKQKCEFAPQTRAAPKTGHVTGWAAVRSE